ncbi:aldo/keto reductase [Pseudonocardia acaciae]|uniref:aldo/keto reductase n=1 Tax=Pseudonocardia acaciae TaxID=551276 RepID=UPI00048AED94|nr:aldo/keto reductase [Pseudonocardia acaciae]
MSAAGSTTVPRRSIGRSGPSAGVLSLGSWHTYDRMDFRDAVGMLREAVDAGVNLFDVGVYGQPDRPPRVFTDVIFSAMVRAAGLRREDYLLSAKLWLEEYPTRSLRDQIENALLRAGVEHADLVVLGDIRHEVDLGQLVLDLAELDHAGLIRSWGVNNWSATNVQTLIDSAASAGVAGPSIAQLKYSVARRSIPDGEPFARIFAQGVSLESSDVFEGGVLLGKGGGARQVGRDPGGIRERIEGSVAGVRAVADELGATPAQLCLAFTLTHPANATTLFGATGIEQLRENLAAVDLVERVGGERLRELVTPFWADRGVVDPEGP